MFYNDDGGDGFKALDGLVLFWFKDMFLPTWVFCLFVLILGQICLGEAVESGSRGTEGDYPAFLLITSV